MIQLQASWHHFSHEFFFWFGILCFPVKQQSNVKYLCLVVWGMSLTAWSPRQNLTDLIHYKLLGIHSLNYTIQYITHQVQKKKTPHFADNMLAAFSMNEISIIWIEFHCFYFRLQFNINPHLNQWWPSSLPSWYSCDYNIFLKYLYLE